MPPGDSRLFGTLPSTAAVHDTKTHATTSQQATEDEFEEREEYEDAGESRRLLEQADGNNNGITNLGGRGVDSFFFEHVAEQIQERDRKKLHARIVTGISFFWAIVSCLCAGSITAYSLYGPLFQSHLKYNEYQVNIVSITAEIGLYGVVPVFGFICDRYGPGISAFLSSIFFSLGYFLAAFTFHSGPPKATGQGEGWPFGVMVFSFFLIGMGTASLYLAAVTTCAKNFSRSKYKGFALAAPIAAMGLSGMWQSQVGSRLLYERNEDGSKTGDVDVFKYFLFLAILLTVVGLIGSLALKIVDEKLLIDDAVDELERSGLIEDSAFFQRGSTRAGTSNYGTIRRDTTSLLSSDEDEDITASNDISSSRKWLSNEHKAKKQWLLNEETRRFLKDPTLWFLAAGFFLVTGPGEAFINNLGTVIGTLYPDPMSASLPQKKTGAATHVSIVAFSSTVARLLSGTLSDIFGPTPVALSQRRPRHRRGEHSLASSTLSSLDPLLAADGLSPNNDEEQQGFTIPRVALLIAAALLSSAGSALLASGLVQDHAVERFWIVSALIGTGYGAVFSLVPLIVSCVWGVHNFATNWSIVAMVPAFGATVWGAVYASVYEMEGSRQRRASATTAMPLSFSPFLPTALSHGGSVSARSGSGGESSGAHHCYGPNCYQATFWAMTGCVWLACVLWAFAWKGPQGWSRRGVRV